MDQLAKAVKFEVNDAKDCAHELAEQIKNKVHIIEPGISSSLSSLIQATKKKLNSLSTTEIVAVVTLASAVASCFSSKKNTSHVK